MNLTESPRRKLTMFGALTFGIAYMAPAVVLSLFGVVSSASGGAAPTPYLIATVAMLFTALSYGKLARHFPSSGTAYFYARRLLDGRLGFLVGWAILLDYLFLPALAWLFMATFFHAQFGFLPLWAWLLLTAAATTIINALGVILSDRINRLLVLVAITMVILFSIWCVVYAARHGHSNLAKPLWNGGTSVHKITAAAAIAAYAFLGFEAISTLTDVTEKPERNIPRATILAVLLGGVFFTAVSYITQLAIPGGNHADAAYFDIAKIVGGTGFANAVNIMYLIGGFASCMAIQAATARLLLVMGRDGVFPRRVFGHVDPRFNTPVINLVLVGLTSLLALWNTINTLSSFINFGALAAYTAVNICVIAFYVRQRRAGIPRSPWGYIVLPLLGAAVCIYLAFHLDGDAIKIGLGWLAAGVVYLLLLTQGFRKAPPELSLADPPPNLDERSGPAGSQQVSNRASSPAG